MTEVLDVSAPFGVTSEPPTGVLGAQSEPSLVLESQAALLPHRHWMKQYRIALVTVDFACILLATILGYGLRFRFLPALSPSLVYLGISAALVIGWLIALQAAGGYEIRHLASGPTETKLVLRASAMTLSMLAIYSYATKTEVARGFVVAVIPVGTCFLLVGRAATRSFVQRRRRHGAWSHRILAVGTSESVRHLFAVTDHATDAGLQIVGACVEDMAVGENISADVPVLGGVFDVAATAERIDADVVAVTGSGLGPTSVRKLGWQLEGTGRGLVMAPGLTQIAGTRVHVSPVEGLPLVWLEQPHLGRLPVIAKRTLDVLLGSLLFVVAVPVVSLAACLIKLTSRGPVFFRQRRLGIHGSEFTMFKLRSMHANAAQHRDDYLGKNEQDGEGVLFKIRRDPRITPVGRWIRQFSIDELPQLLHVVSGKMSLVGPRPLAAIDSTYTGSDRRRLLVRPGLTGLWQVSGRSDLSWADAVRLDLYYVENWSIGLDLSILGRTIGTVLARSGAC